MTSLTSFLKHLRKEYTNPIQILSEIREGNTSQLISRGQHYPHTKTNRQIHYKERKLQTSLMNINSKILKEF